jgi:DNA-binding transcriptional ArsR family regulator
MRAEPDVASVAALIANPARAAILHVLMDERSHAAGELARAASVSPSTASSHLSALAGGALVVAEPSGRHRAYRLAGPAVAEAIEALSVLAPQRSSRPPADGALRAARTCYDHLAGELGVGVTQAFVRRRILRPDGMDFELTRSGEQRLAGLGVDVDGAREQRRAFARACLDWTERQPHLAGALGAAVLRRFLELDWLRRSRTGRAVRLTAAGGDGLRETLGLDLVVA